MRTGADRTAADLPGLPNLLVIGAMKAGTSALHRMLDAHPDICMAAGKELNFFFGPPQRPDSPPGSWWRDGQWHRGPAWYAAQFDAQAPVRGETSPGYTDPGKPGVAPRVAALLPAVRLVMLVRDPVDRAVSQWSHHRRDGTEPRPLEQAVLDPDSQYLARSRYAERLEPFLAVLPRESLLVVVNERLRADRAAVLAAVHEHVGVVPLAFEAPARGATGGTRTAHPAVPERLRREVWDRVGDDVDALRRFMDDHLPEWDDPRRRPRARRPARRAAGSSR